MNRKHKFYLIITAVVISTASSRVATGQCPGGRCSLSPRPQTIPLGNLGPGNNFGRPSAPQGGMPGSAPPGGMPGQHNKADECPPGTQQRPRNCDDVRRMAYQLAAKKGYQMSGGVPTVMTRPYRINFNDCSTGNAHMACMFNDPCTSPNGELLGLRSRSAYHATTLWRGTDGSQFECDFTPGVTPGSSGILIANRGDTRVGPAFPDPGESLDPAYDCEKNGASASPLNPGIFGGGGGGGGGGMPQNMAILGILMSLLNGGQEDGKETPAPDTSNPQQAPSLNESEAPAPTKKPTPTPATSKNKGSNGSKAPSSDAGIVSQPSDPALASSEPLSGLEDSDTLDEEESDEPTPQETPKGSGNLAVWEERQGSIFGSN